MSLHKGWYLILFALPVFAGETRQIEVDDATTVKLWETRDESGTNQAWFQIDRNGKSVVRRGDYRIRLLHQVFDPTVQTPPAPLAHLATRPDQQLYIVQFHTQPLQAYRDAITELGGRVYVYLANHAHLVNMDEPVHQAVAQLPYVRWIGPYHPAYRLEPALLDTQLPRLRYNIMVLEGGFAHKGQVAERITAMGGEVHRADAGKFLLDASLSADQLYAVAAMNEVLFIDRWSPYEIDMVNQRVEGGANALELETNYTGQGVRGNVYDLGFNPGHIDFQSRPLIEYNGVNAGFHGAATSGIVFGDGTGDSDARGLLPSAQGIITEAGNLSVSRYENTGEMVEAPYNAVFQTSSVGFNQVTDYTTISADRDAALFDFDLASCQSQSNTGNRNSRPEAWAKNIISVGAFLHFDTLTRTDDCWCSGFSIGPAEDGRIKPDLSAYGDQTHTVGSTGNNYTFSFGGTSGATPITCGHVGLVYQMWSEGAFGNEVDAGGTVFENRCHMTTAKALLINTANQYEFTGTAHDMTRVHQGWGTPDVETLYGYRDTMFIVDEADLLGNMQAITYQITVQPAQPAFRATMVYADPPGVPASMQHRINDLTLKVTSPSGTIYWGNNGLLEGNWSTPDGVANELDTVENVFVQNPQQGTWLVEVSAVEINQDSHVETPALDADFSLVVTGGTFQLLAPCPLDLNGDRLIDTVDLGLCQQNWSQNEEVGDVDGDGIISILDWMALNAALDTACI